MIPRSVVTGRRIAAAGLVLSAVAAVALLVVLGTWWLTGSLPFAAVISYPGARP